MLSHSPGPGPWGALLLIPLSLTECCPAPGSQRQKRDRGLWSSAVCVRGQCGGRENSVGGLVQMGALGRRL